MNKEDDDYCQLKNWVKKNVAPGRVQSYLNVLIEYPEVIRRLVSAEERNLAVSENLASLDRELSQLLPSISVDLHTYSEPYNMHTVYELDFEVPKVRVANRFSRYLKTDFSGPSVDFLYQRYESLLDREVYPELKDKILAALLKNQSKTQ